MYTTEERLPPGGWSAEARDDERLEFARSMEFWTGTTPVRLHAVRDTAGPLAAETGPLWRLYLESGRDSYESETTLGYTGSRPAAERRLYEVMDSIETSLGDAEGEIDHERLIEAVAEGSKPPVRTQ